MPDPGVPPRLMLVSRHRLSNEAIENIRQCYKLWLSGDNEAMVIEDMDVYQFIDDQWRPITPVTIPRPPLDQIVTMEP